MNSIELEALSKSYDGSRYILNNINLRICKGEYIQVVGKSGSGKSTLLNLIGLLDSNYKGNIRIEGQDITRLSDNKVSEIRSKSIGFIFQAYNLVHHMTSLENIYLPVLYSKQKFNKEYISKVDKLVQEFNISSILSTPVQYLSGGEKQRVSIARALALDPSIILADEPTGNLDKENSNIIFSTLKKLANNGKTVILVTHNYHEDLEVDRILKLQNGVLV